MSESRDAQQPNRPTQFPHSCLTVLSSPSLGKTNRLPGCAPAGTMMWNICVDPHSSSDNEPPSASLRICLEAEGRSSPTLVSSVHWLCSSKTRRVKLTGSTQPWKREHRSSLNSTAVGSPLARLPVGTHSGRHSQGDTVGDSVRDELMMKLAYRIGGWVQGRVPCAALHRFCLRKRIFVSEWISEVTRERHGDAVLTLCCTMGTVPLTSWPSMYSSYARRVGSSTSTSYAVTTS